MGLSAICAIHCLATPLLVSLLPSLGVLNLENEAFHLSMLALVIPLSLFGLTLGCKKHQRKQFLLLGAAGVTLLILAVTIGHDFFGEFGEKSLTVLGAVIVSVAHYRNFKLCQQHHRCHSKEGCAS